ncbi:MAG TPA: hypothetical protein VLL54_12555 [Pyrinomonadaceae bacterium]|nr:hypothetical protein [Pyrinomonadaceae bacterium]
MHTLTKTNALEKNLQLACYKCYFQSLQAHHAQPKELIASVKEIKHLYDKNLVGEEVYRDLLKAAISIYIAHELSSRVVWKVTSAVNEKLSPCNLLALI